MKVKGKEQSFEAEEAVCAGPESRKACCAGELKGWRIVAEGKEPGGEVGEIGGRPDHAGSHGPW